MIRLGLASEELWRLWCYLIGTVLGWFVKKCIYKVRSPKLEPLLYIITLIFHSWRFYNSKLGAMKREAFVTSDVIEQIKSCLLGGVCLQISNTSSWAINQLLALCVGRMCYLTHCFENCGPIHVAWEETEKCVHGILGFTHGVLQRCLKQNQTESISFKIDIIQSQPSEPLFCLVVLKRGCDGHDVSSGLARWLCPKTASTLESSLVWWPIQRLVLPAHSRNVDLLKLLWNWFLIELWFEVYQLNVNQVV